MGITPGGACIICDVLLLQTVIYDLEMTVTFIHSVLDAVFCLDRFHYLGQEIFPSLLWTEWLCLLKIHMLKF